MIPTKVAERDERAASGGGPSLRQEAPATAVALRDLTRTVLAVALIAVLIGASLWILAPFLLPIIWAAMIVVATWPLMRKVEAGLRRRFLAVMVMTGAMLLLLIVPLLLAIQALVGNMDTITEWLHWLVTRDIPEPPALVRNLPLVGASFAERWTSVAAAGKEQLALQLAPYSADAAKWLATAAGSLGLMTLQFLLTVIVAAIMYARGETAAATVIRFGRRLAGERGESVVRLAAQAIRGVALGVVVTALVQTLLAGIGLAVSGVPFAGLLTAVILLLCIAQVGPIIVLLPAVIWLFWSGATGWGSALLVWTVLVGALDNVLRPILIRKGADLPLLLIFSGVIGGLIAFGILGLFVGPVVFAVTYRLLQEWISETHTA